MAKKRKTKEQKRLADLRHNFVHTITSVNALEPSISLKYQPKILTTQKPEKAISTSAYPYLVKDLSKTALLTGAIFTLQVILLFFLKNHTLIIPGLNY